MVNNVIKITHLPYEWMAYPEIPGVEEIRKVLGNFELTNMSLSIFVLHIRTLLNILYKLKDIKNQSYVAHFIFDLIACNIHFSFIYENLGITFSSKIHEFKEKGVNCPYNKKLYDRYSYLISLIQKGIQKRKDNLSNATSFSFNVGIHGVTKMPFYVV